MIQFQAGAVDITPPFKTTLGCNGFLHELFHKVDEKLEVNCLRLGTDSGKIFILSCDVLFVSSSLRKVFLNELLRFGFEDHEFLFCASHTHFAPMVDETKPALGIVDEQYQNFFVERTLQLIRETLSKKPITVRLRTHSAKMDMTISRRRKIFDFSRRFPFFRKSVRMLPNRKGYSSGALNVLKFENTVGELCGIVWNFPCHPVNYPKPRNLTSHYPGTVRSKTRTQVGVPNLPILFLQGFSGNIRPKVIKRITGIKPLFIFLRYQGYDFDTFSYEGYHHFCQKLTNVLCSDFDGTTKDNLTLNSRAKTVPLENIIGKHTTQTGRFLGLRFIKLCESVCLLAMSAEVVSDYEQKVKWLLDSKIVLTVSCIDDTFGYLPTHQMVRDGGYEVSGFFRSFNVEGEFSDGFENLIEDSIKELVNE